jgi:hypothetical protein
MVLVGLGRQRSPGRRKRRPGAIPLGAPWKEKQALRLMKRYGVLVQTFASVLPTRFCPPGPSFQAYQAPFCETTQ